MINDTEIASKPSIKYLGVTLGRNMTFTPHILQVANTAQKNITALTKLMPNIGGPSLYKRRTLAMVAYSIMLYATNIWHNALNYKKKTTNS